MPAEAAVDVVLATHALREVAKGRRVLMIVDDAWAPRPANILTNFIDPATPSRALITTRIQSLVPAAVEVPLGVLPPDEGARLLLSVGDVRHKEPPYSEEVLAAVKA